MTDPTLGNSADFRRAILFFNGWGFDWHAAADLGNGLDDVFEFHDYRHIEVIDPKDFESYDEIYLIAWSLGVAAAAHAITPEFAARMKKCIAINGTLRMCDAENGIAPEIFQGTIDHWHEAAARRRFMARLGAPRDITPYRDWQEQRLELIALRDLAPGNMIYTHAFIGQLDRIVPAAAQKHFWNGTNVSLTVYTDMPHALLQHWHSFESFLEGVDE